MAGYTRQSAADIVTGAVVLAAPINSEFNALQSAFHGTTGHTHDATSGNGPKITLTTSVTGTLPFANGGTNAITAAAARTSLFGVSTTTDNAIARYDGITGSLQNSGASVNDSGEITAGTGTVTTATSADQLVAVGATVTGLLIENTDLAGSGFITFGDGALAGRIVYNHSTNAMTFNTNAALALTLSSAGAGTFVGGITATTATFSSTLSVTGVATVGGLINNTATADTATDLRIGSMIMIQSDNEYNLNAAITLTIRAFTNIYTTNGAVGQIMVGTWRSRGRTVVEGSTYTYLAERTA